MMSPWLAPFSFVHDTHDNPLPIIGVSACLLGRPVRYNGERKHAPDITDMLAQHVQFDERCPEVGIGLPVPRPPIQAVESSSMESGATRNIRIVGIEQPENDFTDALTQYAQHMPSTLHGFVLKARSPSCGVNTTPLVNQHGKPVRLISGQFAHTLHTRFPCMPICDESTLTNNEAIFAFVLRVYFYRHWQHNPTRRSSDIQQWQATLSSGDALPECKAPANTTPAKKTTRTALMHYLERLAAYSQ